MDIKREIYRKISEHLSEKEITLIIGPRQAGKTTLAKQLQVDLKNQGKQSVFFNLDIESDLNLLESQEKFLFALRNQVGETHSYVFIDEFQRKKNGGKFLKGIYDMDLPYKFIITGSGSIELKEEVHESLAGRKRTFELGTLSFSEFINFKTEYTFEGKLSEFSEIYPEKVELYLKEYLTFGGYPKVALLDTIDEKVATLQEIYNSYLIKDITALLNIDRTSKFQKLLENLSILDGKLINLTQLSNYAGISIPTIEKYLCYLEKTFIISPSRPYSQKSLKEINKSYIYYFTDLGMKNLISNNLGEPSMRLDLGFDFQSFIFNEIKHILRDKQPLTFNFWRSKDGAEVDIIVKKAQSIIAIECKFSEYSNPSYTKSMHSFIKKYKPKKFFIVNKNYSKEEVLDGVDISFIPFARIGELVSIFDK